MNLEPLLSRLQIRTKQQTQVPLVPNWAQKEILREIHDQYEAERPIRIIVLKARQLGVSTLAEAVCYLWAVMFPNTNSAVVAHQREATENLFEKTKLYHDTFPFRDQFPLKYATRRHMQFAETGSQLMVMTADNTNQARSRTIHCLHASEVAFWKEPVETMGALAQTIPNLPGTCVILESTANGIGNWWEQTWVDAQQGTSDYVPLFFPWWKEPTLIPCQGYHCMDGSCQVCGHGVRELTKLDVEERELTRLGVDLPHLAWRRWAIPNLVFGSIDMFHQEFPSTPTEAFITSGVRAFPEHHLNACFEQLQPGVGRLVNDDTRLGGVRFVPDPQGPLRLYRMPSTDQNWGQYFVGADSCYGVAKGDYAAAQVINRHNFEQVAVWHGKINPIAFADELAKLGAFYNQAMIAPETEGPGQGTIGRLVSIYPRIWHHKVADRYPGENEGSALGWSTNWKRKAWMIGKLGEYLEKQRLIIHDARTFHEMRGYTYLGFGGFGPSDVQANDDLVMSLGIAVLCSTTEGLVPWETRPSPNQSGLIFGENILETEWAN